MLDLNRLMAAGLGEEAKQLVQDLLNLQEIHRRETVVLGKLRADWEAEHQRAEHYKKLYEENLAFQERVRDWLKDAPA